MKSFVRFAGCFVAACALASTISGCSGGGQGSPQSSASTNQAGYTLVQEGKLTVASDLANPPLDFVEKGSTEPRGFEVDLMEAVASKMGVELEYLPAMKFDSIIPLIKQGGRADLGVSNFTITDERAQEIDFSTPYLDSNQGVVVKTAGGPADLAALNNTGVKVAVQAGTTGAAWAVENLPNAEVVSLDDPVVAVTGVQTGSYAAAIADLPVVQYLCTQSFTDCHVLAEIPTGEQYGIVASKDNPGLTAAVNKALAELEQDGTIASLQKKWFGAEL